MFYLAKKMGFKRLSQAYLKMSIMVLFTRLNIQIRSFKMCETDSGEKKMRGRKSDETKKDP